ncbi:hypothetical protein Ddye_000242 [Dipteronia dyeriana]|uniref:Cytochrome P450 n=1 Tax=Dipteronia dyeriana TaxID=168575 RepID=A0AAD9XLV2_9ROSI|nr:hypothetical protein Ddye_000242 [Dipteronia dyeriana]
MSNNQKQPSSAHTVYTKYGCMRDLNHDHHDQFLRIVCETLGLYPPVPFNHKATTLPDILPTGHHVNRDTKMLISFYSMGRLEEIWGEDCLQFKPERWISEQGQIVHRPSYQFAAFGAGPRSCIGKDIALIQMKMVATAMLWNYRMQLVDDHPISPRTS